MGQGDALPLCKTVTRRQAVGFAAMALGVILAIPRSGRGATPKALSIAVLDPIPALEDSDSVAHLAATVLAGMAHRIAALIADDLRGTGQFAPLDSSALASARETGMPSPIIPRFEVWRAAGVDALVTGSIGPAGERLKLEFRLWDIQSGHQLVGQQYIAQAEDWQRIAHAFSSSIYERLIGGKRDFG
jgi:TolB protein